MTETGINQKWKNLISDIFKKYPGIELVKLYGSRAKGDFNERSDIDLVVFGEKIDRFIISKMLLDFDDLDIPNKIELQQYNDIKNQKLKEHIDRIGKVFYEKINLN